MVGSKLLLAAAGASSLLSASVLLTAVSSADAFAITSSSGALSRQSSQTTISPSRLYEQQEDGNGLLFAFDGGGKNNSTTVLLMPDKDSSSSSPQQPQSFRSSSSAQFGDVVSLKRPSGVSSPGDNDAFFSSPSSSTSSASAATTFDPTQIKQRNFKVAAISIGLAIVNYVWQFLHPVSPIQLLYQMEQQSSPITVIGTTNKPTVVDFWAPWCENCKLLAPTLLQIEEEYADQINFVMINGDTDAAWPLIEAFGVDAIPHLALVEADGTVDTALIGPVPKQWLERDLQVLIENAKTMKTQPTETTTTTPRAIRPLPYQMLDVFANRPEERRIQVQTVNIHPE